MSWLLSPVGGVSDLGDISNVTKVTWVKGDLLAYNGASWVDLPVGADTEVLTADAAEATGIKWAAAGGGLSDGTVDDAMLRWDNTGMAWIEATGLRFTDTNGLRVFDDSGETDYIELSHNDVDAFITMVNTTNLDISGQTTARFRSGAGGIEVYDGDNSHHIDLVAGNSVSSVFTTAGTLELNAAASGGTVRTANGDNFYVRGGVFRVYDTGVLDYLQIHVGTADVDFSMGGSVPPLRYKFRDSPIFIEEIAAARGSLATYGQLWIKDDVPNTLWFTDDAGNDLALSDVGSQSVTISSGWTAGTGGSVSIQSGATFELDDNVALDWGTGNDFSIVFDGTDVQFTSDVGSFDMVLNDLDLVLNGRNLYIVEGSAADADTATYGQWWVQDDAPNTPWFTDDAGGDQLLDPSVSEINGKTADYTLILGDKGKTIRMTGSTASQTITIPANGSVALPIGTLIGIQNDSTVVWSVAITTDTLTGTDGTTGTRTLGVDDTAVIQKTTATTWKYAASDL